MNRPELDFCLLIPCYDNLDGLIISLNTVHYPTNRYLVLIVDDGSTQPVGEGLLKERLSKPQPLVILRNEKNLGITVSLNAGLHWILENTAARYIARLDCGDRCREERFAAQVDFLDNNDEVALLGSWCRFEDPRNGRGYDYITPTDHHAIRRAMHFRNVFIHPTVMIRSSIIPLTGYYPMVFPYAEDYAFFWKLTDVHRSHIIPGIFVICEINSTGISYKNKNRQLMARWRVIRSFSKSSFWKILGFMRLIILYVLPKNLILRVKQFR